jgi:hypothetical protein
MADLYNSWSKLLTVICASYCNTSHKTALTRFIYLKPEYVQVEPICKLYTKLKYKLLTSNTLHKNTTHKLYSAGFFFIFILAPYILKIHLVSHTNKCINYILYYLKSVYNYLH